MITFLTYSLTFLLGLTAFYLLALLFTWLFANKMIFPAPACSYDASLPNSWLTLPDGRKMAALDLIPERGNGWTVLYSHGNGEDLGLIYPTLEAWQQQGFRLFAYDYPGYGLSEGKPDEAGVLACVEQAYRYLVEKHNVDPQKLLLYGRSLGSGPSVHLAAHKPVGALILEGAFMSTYRVVTRFRLLPGDRFINYAKINRVTAPLLVMHGRKDRVVPFWHGPALLRTFGKEGYTLYLDEAGHNNFVATDTEAYWSAVKKLLKL